jgi:hypothetical protein
VPKVTGIVSQTVKDVLQSLVDDRLVTAEKIGSSNFFWSFPSTALQTRENTRRSLNDELSKLRESREKMEKQLQEASSARQDTPERTELLQTLAELELAKATASAKLEMHRANDPKLLATKRQVAKEAKLGSNRWTDNIFTIQSYCSNNYCIPRSQFNEQFSIPDDFDYAE